MDGWRLKPVRLFSSDLDGTLAGNPASERAFHDIWNNLSPDRRPLLVYNSGRLVEDIADFIPRTGLPLPDIMIGGVGSQLTSDRFREHGALYSGVLGPPLQRETIDELMAGFGSAVLQDEIYQHSHKSSWHLPNATPDMLQAIEERLADAGISAGLVYSSNRDLDILPQGADKGSALRWLAETLDIGLDEVLVAGDTGNDRKMFELPDVRGIVVGNALPELSALAENHSRIYRASQRMAEGVIEGFAHFGLR